MGNGESSAAGGFPSAGDWRTRRGHGAMGTLDWGHARLGAGNERFFPCPIPYAQCPMPMPHDGRCYNGGDLRNALPPPCHLFFTSVTNIADSLVVLTWIALPLPIRRDFGDIF